MTVTTQPKQHIQFAAIRERSIGQLLDYGVHIYRRDFWKFLAIVAVILVPLGIIQMVIAARLGSDFGAIFESLDNPANPIPPSFSDPTTSLLSNFLSLVSVFFNQFAYAAIALVVSQALLGGDLSVTGAYRIVLENWTRILGLAIAYAVIGIVLIIWFIVVPIVGWFTGPGIIFFFGQALWPLMIPIIMLEDTRVVDAPKRAWNLTRVRFWPVFWYVIALYLLSIAVYFGPYITIFGGIGAFIGSNAESLEDASVMGQIFSSAVILGTGAGLIANLFYLPIKIIGMTLLYFDLRVRQEGLDLALASAPIEALASDKRYMMVRKTPSERIEAKSWVTGNELMRFFVILIGFITAIAAFYGTIFAIATVFMGLAGV